MEGRKMSIFVKELGLKNLMSEAIERTIVDGIRERLISEQELSVTKLKNHIRQNHPMKTNDEYWPICLGTGQFISLEEKRDIPDFIRDIGLGPALYLLTLKALGKIFLALSILNIPALYFFYNGTEADGQGLTGINRLFA